MIYYVDLDGVICTNTYGAYEKAKPLYDNIKKINRLFDDGHEIVIWTARGTKIKRDWRFLTEKQLKEWRVKYHNLLFGKPYYDKIIDDRALDINELR